MGSKIQSPRCARISALALLAASGAAHAQTANWNALDGNWSTAANWSPAVVPDGATFDAILGVTTGAYTVTLDINPTLNSLLIDNADARLDFTTNSISIGLGGLNINAGRIRGNVGGGALMTVAGNARFTGVGAAPELNRVDMILNGVTDFDLAEDIDICDSDVTHGGTGNTSTWTGTGDILARNGATITLQATNTFLIQNDRQFRHNNIGATPTYTNNGTILKQTGVGVTEFEGVTLVNTGTLRVESGTFRTDGVSTAGNTLSGGTWEVVDSTLDLVGATITTNSANVTLQGAASSFAAINGLQVNSTGATFALSNGRNFTTTGVFSNTGTLTAGSGTQFTAASTFTQGSGTINGGGTVRIEGAATFNGATSAPVINGATTVNTRAGLTIAGSNGLVIDNSAQLTHNGSTGQWSGAGSITMDNGAKISIESGALLEATNNQSVVWDNSGTQPEFNVAGTFTKKQSAGITFLDGVKFNNTGAVRVESGTLRSNQAPVAANTLSAGRWVIQGGSSLDFVGSSVVTNAADVTIDGASSSFAALEQNLQLNAGAGILTIRGGKTLTTAGDFDNDGRVAVGAGSAFEVNPGSNFISYNSGTQTLESGEIVVESSSSSPGVFRWLNPNFKIVRIAGKITLRGLGSLIDNGTRANESALNELAIISETGSFEVLEARNFTTEGDLIVEESGLNKGRLSIGLDSTVTIPNGFTLQNFDALTGEISSGRFDITGTLAFPNAEIRRVSSVITLSGTQSRILNTNTGQDAFGALERITGTGDLTLRDGRDLLIEDSAVTRNLLIEGRLGLGPGTDSDETRVTVRGDVSQQGGSLLEIFQNASLSVEFAPLTGGGGNYTLDTDATLNLQGGELSVQGALQLNGNLSGNGFINGNPVVNGVLGPGNSPGFLGIGGTLLLADPSRLVLDVTNYGAGVGFDIVTAAGSIVIAPGAKLDVVAVESLGFQFAAGQVFTVLSAAGGISGDFAPVNITGLDLDDDLYFVIDRGDPTAFKLVVVPAPSIGAIAVIGVLATGRRRRATR